MQVTFSQNHDKLKLAAVLDDDDREEFGKARMAARAVTYHLPVAYQVRSAHPDLLALAALTTFSPWIGKTLELPFSVSERFAEECKKSLRIQITNTSSWVKPRENSSSSRPGVSFSAGVDSFACLAIMPESTVPVFSHRTPPKGNSSTLYRDEAPLYAIEQLKKSGREVYAVESDLEWLRSPVGFGVDPSPSTPLILLADYFDLDAIAFGTIAEAAYRTGSEHFIDYAERPIFLKWQAVFQAAAISYYNCVAPLSEMCTTKITRESPFGELAQSCVRGLPSKPCMQCVKCFRKTLIEASFSGNWPNDESLRKMLSVRAIKNYLKGNPIRLEIILESTLQNYEGDSEILNALKDRVVDAESDVSFTKAWYEPGINQMVPEKYRTETKEKILKYIPKMTPEQVREFENYNITGKISRIGKSGRMNDFEEYLEKLNS